MNISHIVGNAEIIHEIQEGGILMPKEENAKAITEEGIDDKATEVVTTPLEPEKPAVTPKPKEGEGEKEPSEKLQQRLSTVEGMLRKSQDRVNQLEGESRNFEGLTVSVDGLRQDLNLVTDVLSQMTTDNEELQEKVAKSRQVKQEQEKQKAEAKEAWGQIGSIAMIAKMQPDDEALKPTVEAWRKGEHKQAIKLATLAVESKVSSLQIVKPDGKVETEPPEKKKLPVNTSTSAASETWREQSPKDKIKDALQEAREQ